MITYQVQPNCSASLKLPAQAVRIEVMLPMMANKLPGMHGPAEGAPAGGKNNLRKPEDDFMRLLFVLSYDPDFKMHHPVAAKAPVILNPPKNHAPDVLFVEPAAVNRRFSGPSHIVTKVWFSRLCFSNQLWLLWLRS